MRFPNPKGIEDLSPGLRLAAPRPRAFALKIPPPNCIIAAGFISPNEYEAERQRRPNIPMLNYGPNFRDTTPDASFLNIPIDFINGSDIIRKLNVAFTW